MAFDTLSSLYTLGNTDVEVPELNEDEENIIHYPTGYIPFKLLKKDKKNDYDRLLV